MAAVVGALPSSSAGVVRYSNLGHGSTCPCAFAATKHGGESKRAAVIAEEQLRPKPLTRG